MVLKLKKILIPYDSTESSVKAFKNLIPIIERHHSKIILLTCIRDKATFGFFKTKSDKKEIDSEKEKAIRFHEKARNEAQKHGLQVCSKIVKSDLESKSIVDFAKKEDVDIIVMSRTKLATNAERMYYESTVDAVFKKTPCLFLYVP